MVGRWCLALLALIAVGCATNEPAAPTTQLPPYRDPSTIKPSQTIPPVAGQRSQTRINGSAWEPPVPSRNWRYIVIHHSATAVGSATAFDREHRAKGWDELGYHFVIGNGTGSRDGLIEIGPRWFKQKHGAHTKTADNQFNEYGIGICLVGNFEQSNPTPAQLEATARLVGYLMHRYNVPADRVIGHGQAKPTDCPGKYFPLARLKSQASAIAAGLNNNTYADLGQ